MAEKWTTDDESRLIQAISECYPLIEYYKGRGYKKVNWWDTVAGKLAPELLVTGRACERRWLDIRSRPVQPTVVDRWLEVAAAVDNYERELQEVTYDLVESIDNKLSIICRELGVEI